MSKKEIYVSKYVFPIEKICPELVTYIQKLKHSVPTSPWFGSIVFRSLIQDDDRQRAKSELLVDYQVELPEWHKYSFLLMVTLKDPYKILSSDQEIVLVQGQSSQMEDRLLVLAKGIPAGARGQWQELIRLYNLCHIK